MRCLVLPICFSFYCNNLMATSDSWHRKCEFKTAGCELLPKKEVGGGFKLITEQQYLWVLISVMPQLGPCAQTLVLQEKIPSGIAQYTSNNYGLVKCIQSHGITDRSKSIRGTSLSQQDSNPYSLVTVQLLQMQLQRRPPTL